MEIMVHSKWMRGLGAVLQWFLERDTRQWEFVAGLIGLMVAGWVGWPFFHPYMGKSDLYRFMQQHLPDWVWATGFALIWVTHWAFLALSQWSHVEHINWARARGNLCFWSATIWLLVFQLYLSDQAGGVAIGLSFSCAFAEFWTFVILFHGDKARRRRLVAQVDKMNSTAALNLQATLVNAAKPH